MVKGKARTSSTRALAKKPMNKIELAALEASSKADQVVAAEKEADDARVVVSGLSSTSRAKATKMWEARNRSARAEDAKVLALEAWQKADDETKEAAKQEELAEKDSKAADEAVDKARADLWVLQDKARKARTCYEAAMSKAWFAMAMGDK